METLEIGLTVYTGKDQGRVIAEHEEDGRTVYEVRTVSGGIVELPPEKLSL